MKSELAYNSKFDFLVASLAGILASYYNRSNLQWQENGTAQHHKIQLYNYMQLLCMTLSLCQRSCGTTERNSVSIIKLCEQT